MKKQSVQPSICCAWLLSVLFLYAGQIEAKRVHSLDVLNLMVQAGAAGVQKQYYQQPQRQREADFSRRIESEFQTGCALLESGRCEESVRFFDLVIQSAPYFVKAYNCRGAAYRELGRVEQALRDVNTALRMDPRHGAAYGQRALIQIQFGNEAKASQDLAVCYQLRPDLRDFYSGQAAHLHEQRLAEEAQRNRLAEEATTTREEKDRCDQNNRGRAEREKRVARDRHEDQARKSEQDKQVAIRAEAEAYFKTPDRPDQTFRRYFHSFISLFGSSAWFSWIAGIGFCGFAVVGGFAFNTPGRSFIVGIFLIVPFIMLTTSQGMAYNQFLSAYTKAGSPVPYPAGYAGWNWIYVPYFLAVHLAAVLLFLPACGGLHYLIVRDPMESMLRSRGRKVPSEWKSRNLAARLRAATDKLNAEGRAMGAMYESDLEDDD